RPNTANELSVVSGPGLGLGSGSGSVPCWAYTGSWSKHAVKVSLRESRRDNWARIIIKRGSDVSGSTTAKSRNPDHRFAIASISAVGSGQSGLKLASPAQALACIALIAAFISASGAASLGAPEG